MHEFYHNAVEAIAEYLKQKDPNAWEDIYRILDNYEATEQSHAQNSFEMKPGRIVEKNRSFWNTYKARREKRSSSI